MGVADRLYESACECRDLETRLDRVLRELDQLRAAGRRVVEAIGETPLPAGAEGPIADLKTLVH